jgi:hypothetical protein
VGHMLSLERPASFAELVASFVADAG